MPRFVKANANGKQPFYIRDDITVILDDNNNGELAFYAPPEGRIAALNKRAHNIGPQDFLPALSAGTNGFIRIPAHWITEKQYGDIYVRPEAVLHLAASKPQPLTAPPGMPPPSGAGVRMLIGFRGYGQMHNYGVAPQEAERIVNELKRLRPDLLPLTPRDAVCATVDNCAVTLLDTSAIGRMKVAEGRVTVTYHEAGAFELRKPPLDKDALLRDAVARDPSVNNPGTLAHIWQDALRVQGEDLESLARGLAREARHLSELRGAATPYFTSPEQIARFSTERKYGGGGEILIAYLKPYSPVYDSFHERIYFKKERDLEAALDILGDRSERRPPSFAPKPPRF
jgi:hypothetical protein